MLPQLQKGDLIYICSPAKAIETEHVNFARDFFVQNGFNVEISKYALGNHNYFSGSVEERLFDFQQGLDHPEAKAILCARGGYGCMHLLDNLHWEKFDSNPKHVVGFSDVTAFHLLLNDKNMPSLHATMPLNFQDNSPESLRSLLSAFSGTPETLCAPKTPFNKEGVARGKVIGGNLAMIHALLPRLDKSLFTDSILFIEDVGEHLYKIDRMLYGLKYAGVLDEVSGVINGGFNGMSDTDTPFGLCLEEIILSHLSHRKIPIGFGFPCGHQIDNQTIVLGGSSILEVDENGSSVLQSFREDLS